jgi:hypothetical protein
LNKPEIKNIFGQPNMVSFTLGVMVSHVKEPEKLAVVDLILRSPFGMEFAHQTNVDQHSSLRTNARTVIYGPRLDEFPFAFSIYPALMFLPATELFENQALFTHFPLPDQFS